MEGCIYKTKECNCTYVVFRDCKVFKLRHARSLAVAIMPFKFKKKEFEFKRPKIVYSSNVDDLKSLALQCAVTLNEKIRKVTLNQAIELAINQDLPDEKIYFVQITQKPYGELEKVKAVYMSFMDKCILANKWVFVTSTVPAFYNAEWCKL